MSLHGLRLITLVFKVVLAVLLLTRLLLLRLGSLSNDDGDVNENGKNAVGSTSKKQLFRCIMPFLYISLPSLLDYDVKMPFFFLKNVNTRQRLSFSFPELRYGLLEISQNSQR